MVGIKKFAAGLKLRLSLKKYQPAEIRIPYDMQNTRNILVCLPPGQRELTVVKQVLPDLSQVFGDAEIYLMASPGSSVHGIFPHKGFRILTPSKDHLTWSGLARRKYLGVLHQNKYDLILDLNLDSSNFVKSVLLSFPRAIRVGSAGNLGAPYYNFEIKSRYLRDEKSIYRSIIEMLGSLKVQMPTKTDSNLN
ncbi:hypothetical protein TRIP_C21460 [Candidatus Zixiibacteriota bacterium]|nr:hypothetical protein TRIP_C21460 [candidate division Zixibacteria bacterium]